MTEGVDKKITRRNLKQGLLAFIDLLGFSSQVQAIKYEGQLRKLDTDVVYVQDQFELKSKEEYIKKSHRISGKRVFAFSDCIVISVALNSDLAKFQGKFDVLLSELHGFGLAQGACAVNGIFIRGGVDIGFWFQRKDTLISPALVNAYELEHSACVPMIAITQSLKKFLYDHPGRTAYAADPLKGLIKKMENLPDAKSQWFINYIPICLREIEPSFTKQEFNAHKKLSVEEKNKIYLENYFQRCMAWAKQHGEAIKAAHSEAVTDKVRSKYEWLAKYHNKEIKLFFGKQAKSLLIEL